MAENIAYFTKNPRALKEQREKVKQDKKRKREAESSSQGTTTVATRSQGQEQMRSETTLVSFELARPAESFQPVDFDETTGETLECTYLVARSRRKGVGPSQVDFVLDTATDSSTIKPADSALTSNLKSDPVSLMGVGDFTVVKICTVG